MMQGVIKRQRASNGPALGRELCLVPYGAGETAVTKESGDAAQHMPILR
jgi:hypothetical protein